MTDVNRATLQPSLGTRLSIQFRVIAALIIRDMMARYGRGNLGFLWLILEPTLLIAALTAVWTLMHRGGGHGVSIAAFVIASYSTLTVYRKLTSSARSIGSHAGLLYHRLISVTDILLARAIVEASGVILAGLLVYAGCLSLGLVDPLADPGLVLLGLGLMTWFAFGFGCILAGLSERYETLDHILQPIQYLMLPISGVFFMVAWLPASVRSGFLWVPMVSIYEIVRAGFYGDQVTTYYSIPYVVLWCIALSTGGLISITAARKNLSR